MRFSGRAALIGLLMPGVWLLASACESDDRPAYYSGGPAEDAGISIDASMKDGPPDPDASGLCGNLILPALVNKPNLYFVLDRSGSMQDQLEGTKTNKYKAARNAIGEVLQAIGHRVRYGAAVFPTVGGEIQGCAAGEEIFQTRDGDPPSYAAAGHKGPVLVSFLNQTGKFDPYGGTPTAATLTTLHQTLTALPGRTIVVLATDGAPNCNLDASCSADECSLTIEKQSIQGKSCTPSFNCCDGALVPDGQLSCVDGDATEAAVAALAAAGIDTYVIGMPGSEYYSALLDRLAIAGNTARPTPPLYYPTESSEQLTEAIRSIGVEVAISCTIALDEAPPDPKLVNVYFDQTLVAYDELDGWAWLDEKTVELRGAACAKLESGDVLQVQVVAGCPTVIR